MKPAICPICNRTPIEMKGDMVEFADYAPLPEGYIGHRPGLEWFCNDHLSAAQAVSNKPYEEAIKSLKLRFGTVSALNEQSANATKPNIVSRFFGILKS